MIPPRNADRRTASPLIGQWERQQVARAIDNLERAVDRLSLLEEDWGVCEDRAEIYSELIETMIGVLGRLRPIYSPRLERML